MLILLAEQEDHNGKQGKVPLRQCTVLHTLNELPTSAKMYRDGSTVGL